MLRAMHGHLASKNENKRQKNIGWWFEVMTVGTADNLALYWYAEPSVLTHRSWCGDYTHTHTHACMHLNCMHTTLTQTHAPTHACNTHTYTHSHTRTQHSHAHTHACMHTPVHHTTNSHAQVINLHVHAHTSGLDRHIHNQVIPAHGLEPCRAYVNLCLSDLLPMQTDRWDPQGTWSI